MCSFLVESGNPEQHTKRAEAWKEGGPAAPFSIAGRAVQRLALSRAGWDTTGTPTT